MDEAPPKPRTIPYGQIALGVAFIATLIVLGRILPIGTWLNDFQQYVKSLGAIGYALYAIVYALCCVFFIPASVLTLGAGAIFGLFRGFIVVIIGAFIGACAAFLLARGALRRRVEAKVADNKTFAALDRAIAREGAKMVFLIRLSPVFPFTYINYAFGLTGVSFRGYALATAIGMLPGTFAFTYLGYAAATAATGGAGSNVRLAIQIVGAIATLAVTIFVARIARRAMARSGVEES
jgi:uncharacterized membrane protein YdjX (TVP38/TMEM64 family)